MAKGFDRKPTKMMTELLMEIHERELMNLPPFTATHAGVRGLFVRDMIKVHPVPDDQGKHSFCIFITQKGKSYLARL